MNTERFKRVLDRIKAVPEEWDQSLYSVYDEDKGCISAYCFIGWAAKFALDEGIEVKPFEPVWVIAARWLDISRSQEGWLCDPYNQLEDFERFFEVGDIPPEGRAADKVPDEAIKAS